MKNLKLGHLSGGIKNKKYILFMMKTMKASLSFQVAEAVCWQIIDFKNKF
jgi:hypothetical protein